MKKIGEFAPGKPSHMSLIEAKVTAAQVQEAAQKGKSVAQVVTTFDRIAEEWLEDYVGAKRQTTAEAVENRYKLYIETAAFYTKKICDITKFEIREELRKLRRKPQTARKVHSIFNMIFDYAIGSDYMDKANPVPKFKYVFDKQIEESPRAAVTDDPDRFGEIVFRIRAQYESNENRICAKYESGDNGAGLLLFLVYCFTRPREARLLQWHNVRWNEGVIKLSPEDTKTKEPLIIPMSKQVIELLQRQKKRMASAPQPNDYVFFSPQKGPKYMLSDAVPTDKLMQLGIERSEQSAHGFRSCASTYLREYLNADDNLVEMQLNHVIGTGVARIYNRAQKLKSRKEMMQEWADWVDMQVKNALDRLTGNGAEGKTAS